MKKIITLIAVLFSVTTFATPAPGLKTSKISISGSDRAKLQVKIDGKMYNLNNTFVMDNVRAGNHSITIYKTESAGFRKKTSVIYNTTMNVSPAQLISIDINRNDRVMVKTTSTLSYDRDNRTDHGRNDTNDHNGRH